jgi:excisionase family DNA binding protein
MSKGKRSHNFIGVSEAARILGVSTNTVRRWVADGKLQCTDSTLGRLFDEKIVIALALEIARENESTKKGDHNG